jgi:hypothetical protein
MEFVFFLIFFLGLSDRIRKTSSIVLLAFSLFCTNATAQDILFQNIRGKVTDRDTNLPLTGASVYIPGTTPLIGSITDTSGLFLLKKVPVGRLGIEVSCLGYLTKQTGDIILTSAKEVFLEIKLETNAIQIREIVINSGLDKNQAINTMASVSARSFSIEETYRYAGSLGDPARMAANFAGVMAESPQRNDIVVRGNSPSGLLWRLDGIEIPNPNHFGTIGTTGGPVTILNNNLLTNSDFFIGAFPAEYGNALAGVFDLKMRNGNPFRREFWGQIGWNGFELGGEGGLDKNNQSSYLVSYRYTFLGLLGKLGIIGYIPQYQDLTVKVNIPTKRAGEFSLIGIEGTSKIEILDSKKPPSDWTFTDEGQDLRLKTGLGLIGISHRITLNDKISLRQNLSVQESVNGEQVDSFTVNYPSPFPIYRLNSSQTKYCLSSSLKVRSGQHSNFNAGISADLYHVGYSDSSWVSTGYRASTLINENVFLLREYAQWQSQFINRIILTGGLYSQVLFMNKSYSIEPRAGLRWLIDDHHALSLGYGLHSQIIPLPVYFFRTENQDGSYSLTNQNLGFSKSHHIIMGYDYSINPNLRLKTEIYYQLLFNIPVRSGTTFPEYSLINFGESYGLHEIDSLVNNGKGRNAGIEITLERFFKKGYYWLTTISLFDSRYTGSDGVWRHTAFDGNFIVNLLGGHEWTFHTNHTISLDIKTLYAGGKRYVPVDIEKSMAARRTIYDWGKAYENKYDNFFRLDIRLGYNLNLAKVSHRFAIDLQNVTNHQNLLIQRVDPVTGEIINDYQIGFFPMITWKVEFAL